jgi:hypothetical protein
LRPEEKVQQSRKIPLRQAAANIYADVPGIHVNVDNNSKLVMGKFVAHCDLRVGASGPAAWPTIDFIKLSSKSQCCVIPLRRGRLTQPLQQTGRLPLFCPRGLNWTMDPSALKAHLHDDGAVVETLQNIVVDSSDVNEFLHEFCDYSARAISGSMELPVVCAVTLSRRHRSTTAAWSDPRARVMDEIQHSYGDGPCLHAMNTGTTVLVPDTRYDTRWPEYGQAIAQLGQLSVLAVPLTLDEDSRAALNIFAPDVNAFGSKSIDDAELFAAHAQSSLRLAVRVATSQQLAADLRASMESRTAIDLAAGIIMGQNRCSQEEAMAILVKTSSGRNQKLRVVAENMVASFTSQDAFTHFD